MLILAYEKSRLESDSSVPASEVLNTVSLTFLGGKGQTPHVTFSQPLGKQFTQEQCGGVQQSIKPVLWILLVRWVEIKE